MQLVYSKRKFVIFKNQIGSEKLRIVTPLLTSENDVDRYGDVKRVSEGDDEGRATAGWSHNTNWVLRLGQDTRPGREEYPLSQL